MSGNWEDIFDQYLQGYAPREEAERLSLRIDVPASHHGTDRPETKNWATLDPARRPK